MRSIMVQFVFNFHKLLILPESFGLVRIGVKSNNLTNLLVSLWFLVFLLEESTKFGFHTPLIIRLESYLIQPINFPPYWRALIWELLQLFYYKIHNSNIGSFFTPIFSAEKDTRGVSWTA